MNRRGYMLVEVVAVIGPSAVVMGVALAVIHSTFDVERSVRGQLAARQAVDRLAESFRRDVHAAEHATIATDPRQCILGSAGGPTVVYRVERGQVVRETSGEEGSSSSQHASRTDFPLPRRSTVAFGRFEEAGRTLVGLTIVPEPGSDAPPRQVPQQVRIDALLDRHSIVAGADLPPGKPSGDMP
ncbi:MAG: hypothetical protein RBS80_10800 [Thermoguttaceae bacterium]|jgi:hypothetical protein|nr:hypothetical protein [Thermoguttaceae bacterium]